MSSILNNTPEETNTSTHALLQVPHGDRAVIIRPIDNDHTTAWHVIVVYRCTSSPGLLYDRMEFICDDWDKLLKELEQQL